MVPKHSVLNRYPEVFAKKVGSKARDRRVVFVDAYTGKGRYEDGEPASPELVMRMRERFGQFGEPIDLDCLFIEKNRQAHASLTQIVPDERALHGRAEEQLDTVLRHAEGQPLFMFIDPFGQPIPFDTLAHDVLGRTRRQWPPTEILVNFSVRALQRNAGRLNQKQQVQHATSVLERFDRAMGGPWWHELGRRLAQDSDASDAERQEIEAHLVAEYGRTVVARVGYVSVIAPIWQRGWKRTVRFSISCS